MAETDAPAVPGPHEIAHAVARLRAAGCVAAEEEAADLLAVATTDAELRALVDRRVTGEPLAWITGVVTFGGESVLVHRGVFVPRIQSEALAAEARRRLPEGGVAVDLCTGAGAVAVALARGRPRATVVGTEIDPVAAACARANGVTVVVGDLAAPLPKSFRGTVDVVTSITPYVPTSALALLPRDTLEFEPRLALDGGPDGTAVLRRVVAGAAALLRPGGSLLLETGGDQDELLAAVLAAHGFGEVVPHHDDDGELRALYCRC